MFLADRDIQEEIMAYVESTREEVHFRIKWVATGFYRREDNPQYDCTGSYVPAVVPFGVDSMMSAQAIFVLGPRFNL